ncbi:flagellar export chaperone FliS [bacterium]|nr:MAG: flagellar export chaperone FliS [bacterium]
MPYINPASAYHNQAVQTANGPQLLLMLCDRLAADLARGEAAIEAADYEAGNENLQHAQSILRMLRSALNPDGFTGGHELMAVYAFLERQLIEANLEKNVERVRQCAELFQPIHDAWRAAVSANEGNNAGSNLG